MFGKIAADALGLADIGVVVSPKDYNKVDSDDYIMHEDGEKIFFLIKSKTDEYCFTNQALIHLDGTSAMSKKRLLKRYPWAHHKVENVTLETAGTIDLDIEIKFTMSGHHHSIDVKKAFLNELKDLYKSLLRIAEVQWENEMAMRDGTSSLDVAVTALGRAQKGELPIEQQLAALNTYAFQWKRGLREKHLLRDAGAIFEKYIYDNGAKPNGRASAG